MTRHWDEQGAYTAARLRSAERKRRYVVAQRDGKVSRGPQWYALTYAEYMRAPRYMPAKWDALAGTVRAYPEWLRWF